MKQSMIYFSQYSSQMPYIQNAGDTGLEIIYFIHCITLSSE